MNGRPSREAIWTALFNALVASVQTMFTADTTLDSAILANPSTSSGLFVGLAVFGAGIQQGALIESLSPLTLSLPATANGVGVQMQTGFLTTSRRLQPASAVAAQPALFLRDTDEEGLYRQDSTPVRISLERRIFKAEIWIYSLAGQNPSAIPATALNNLLDAVQTVFEPDDPMTGRFTLGGLVDWCQFGNVIKSPGDTVPQATAVADIEIIVP